MCAVAVRRNNNCSETGGELLLYNTSALICKLTVYTVECTNIVLVSELVMYTLNGEFTYNVHYNW